MKVEFPDLNVPDSKKDKEWHKRFHDAILFSSQIGSKSRAQMVKNVEYLKGQIDPERDYNHLVLSVNGEALPPRMVSFNSIGRFVRQIIGEADIRGTDLNVAALSKSAQTRRRELELDVETMVGLAPIAEVEEEEYGLQLIPNDIPRSPEGLPDAIEDVKEQGEIVYGRMLDYLISINRWRQLRTMLIGDALTAGVCFAKSTIENGYNKIEHLDPRTVIWDISCDPWGNNGQFIGLAMYMPVSEVKTRFKVSDEDLEKIKDSAAGPYVWFGEDDKHQAFMTFGGKNYVLYTHVYFYDTKKLVGIEKEKEGGESLYFIENEEIDEALPRSKSKKIEDERKGAKSVKPLHYRIVREVAMLGGDHCVKYGELENQVRTTDDWQYTQFPIVAYLPGWKYGDNVSMVQELIPLQILKNEALHKLRQNLQRDKGRQVLYDQSQMPEDLQFEDLDYLGQTLGIIPMNSMGPGVQANFNQFRDMDRTIVPQVVRTYWEIAKLADSEMENITGISPSRQGIIESPSIAVGVNEASKVQSAIQTMHLFTGFDEFTEMLFTTALGHAKITFAEDPEKYRHIVGDDGIEFITSDKGYNLDDYGAFVRTSSVSIDDKQVIAQAATLAMQNRAVDFYDGVKLLLEDNPDEALKALKKSLTIKEQKAEAVRREMMASNQAAAQQQSQTMMAIEQGKLQQKQQAEMVRSGTAIKVADINARAGMQKQQAKSVTEALRERAKMLNERAKMAYR